MESKTNSCPKCGQPLIPGASYCPYCGAKVETGELDEAAIKDEIEDADKLEAYSGHYTDEKFTDKLKRMAKKAGVKVVYAACLLFYVLKSEKVLVKDKAIILGALGYFILPFDIIPDFIPVVGYTDDLAALLFALKLVYDDITPEIEAQAKAAVRSFFGEVNDKEFQLF
jgi:uncharacterized membrane protein YkvA (DUF1232 family)